LLLLLLCNDYYLLGRITSMQCIRCSSKCRT